MKKNKQNKQTNQLLRVLKQLHAHWSFKTNVNNSGGAMRNKSANVVKNQIQIINRQRTTKKNEKKEKKPWFSRFNFSAFLVDDCSQS
jgi:hypothetical protein